MKTDWILYRALALCRLLFCVFALIGVGSLPAALSQENENEYTIPWERGEYQRALDLLEKNMSARPELMRAWSFRYVRWMSDRAALRAELGQLDEAITDLEWILARIEEPAFFARLAQLYRDRGRKEEFHAILIRASQGVRPRWGFHSQEENLLALAKLAELQGDNPKQILSTVYGALMDQFPSFSPGFVGAGDLALSKRSFDLAEKYYKKALEINDTNQNALAGLADCYWKAGDPRVEEPLKKLLEINSHSPAARAIEVEMLLDRGAAKEALEKIGEGLELNPRNVRWLSLKAAAHFLLDDEDARKDAQAQVLAVNRYGSEAYRTPGRVASRHYRFREGVEFQRKAVEIDPDDHEARALLALDLLRLGQDEEGKQHLEAAFAADPFNVQVFNLLQLMDSLKAFDRIEESPFVLQLPKTERAVLSGDMMTLLREAFDLYQGKYNVQLETPIHVQVFDDHDDFMVRSVGLPGQVGFLGICFGRLVTMDSPTARPKGEMNWQSVLWHEFVHVITLQKTKNRMPRWLSEGISVYEETQRSAAWGQKMEFSYKPILDGEEWPGVEDLETYFTEPKTPNHLMLGYFLAGEFVRFYVDAYGFGALNTALEKIGEGTDTKEALLEAGGQPLEEMDNRFEDFLSDRLAPYDNLPEIAAKDDAVSKIMEQIFRKGDSNENWLDKDAPFSNALREARQALQEKRWDEAETLLERAYGLYPDYRGEDAPLSLLISLYEGQGQRDKLAGALEREIASNPTALSACKRLIELRREDGAWPEVIKAAECGLGVDPFDVGLRKAVLEARLRSGEAEKAYPVTQQLAFLDPAHRTQYVLQGVEILKQTNRKEEAKRQALLLLEEFPHYWQAQEALLSVLDLTEDQP